MVFQNETWYLNSKEFFQPKKQNKTKSEFDIFLPIQKKCLTYKLNIHGAFSILSIFFTFKNVTNECNNLG